MLKSFSASSLGCLILVLMASFSGAGFAAENHVIVATDDLTWRSDGDESTTDGDPLVVEVKKGDTIEVQVSEGGVPHGFVTIGEAGNASPAPVSATNLVLACGEDPQSKPDAVLREVECAGAQSNFAKVFTGSLKLEVLDTFSTDTNFWCVLHKSVMWGVIKLKQDTAAAENHVIVATDDLTWRSDGDESTTDGDPLVVEVKKGDTIEVQVSEGGVPHGFVTIGEAGNASPAPVSATNLVLACGEDPQSKPDAVLREVECAGAQSNFAKVFTGSLKLEVLDTFSTDTNFWCVLHKSVMWGVIKLKQDTAAAENHVIVATDDLTWRSDGDESTTDGDPLVVEVKKGDTIEVQVSEGGVPHGFVTIGEAGNASPAPVSATNLVLACGEDPQSKPDAVLREVECAGAQSNFAKVFTGSLKLEVLDTFSTDTNFWCVLHKSVMWGVIKLKQDTAAAEFLHDSTASYIRS